MDPFQKQSLKLKESLSAGGMGEVFSATLEGPSGFKKEVAVKRIHAHLSKNSDFVRQFEREIHLSAQLQHKNIVGTHFAGVDDDGHLFMVMELVKGVTLSEWMLRHSEKGKEIPLPLCLYIAAEVASGLSYAHRWQDQENPGRRKGIVHRDISPQNIMISAEGEVKILDFGIAKALDATAMTMEGRVKGKSGYFSPEQASGRELDGRSDVFSLGVVLFELCTGTRLFSQESDAERMAALLRKEYPSAQTRNNRVDKRLSRIIEKCLENKVEKRFESAEVLEDELRRYLANKYSGFSLRQVKDSFRAVAKEKGFSPNRVSIEFETTMQSDKGSPARTPLTQVSFWSGAGFRAGVGAAVAIMAFIAFDRYQKRASPQAELRPALERLPASTKLERMKAKLPPPKPVEKGPSGGFPKGVSDPLGVHQALQLVNNVRASLRRAGAAMSLDGLLLEEIEVSKLELPQEIVEALDPDDSGVVTAREYARFKLDKLPVPPVPNEDAHRLRMAYMQTVNFLRAKGQMEKSQRFSSADFLGDDEQFRLLDADSDGVVEDVEAQGVLNDLMRPKR